MNSQQGTLEEFIEGALERAGKRTPAGSLYIHRPREAAAEIAKAIREKKVSSK